LTIVRFNHRMSVRRHFVHGAIALVALVLVATAGATPAADDVIVDVHFAHQTGTTASSPKFKIEVSVHSTSGVLQPIVVTIGLSDGLRWGADPPDPSEDCVTANPAVCTTRMKANEVGTIETGWNWDVVAERTGAFEISAAVEPAEADPDTSNNRKTFAFEVVSTGGSEGGGPGGGGGSLAVSASAVKLVPARPRAGSTVVASVSVRRGGSPVRPTGVACAASAGATKIKAAAGSRSGLASCLLKPPRTAVGKVLAGSISFRAGGRAFTKRFSTKLG
jgi:hypothetical protein